MNGMQMGIGQREQILEGGRQYKIKIQCGRVRQYITDQTGKVLESLMGVETFVLTIEKDNQMFEVPVGVDTLNLDDRKFEGRKDRAFYIYVKGGPDISKKYLGMKKDESLKGQSIQDFSDYLAKRLIGFDFSQYRVKN